MLKYGLFSRGGRMLAIGLVALATGIGGCTYGRELADGISAGVLNGVSILVSQWVAGLGSEE